MEHTNFTIQFILEMNKGRRENIEMIKKMYQFYKANSGQWKGHHLAWACTMIELGFYVKDKKKIFFVKSIGRGVAVCSPGDEPSDEKGMLWAERHASRALKGREDRLIEDPRARLSIIKTDCPFVFHSERNPDLTFQECKELFTKKEALEMNPTDPVRMIKMLRITSQLSAGMLHELTRSTSEMLEVAG